MDKNKELEELQKRIEILEYHLSIKSNIPIFPLSVELDKLKGRISMNDNATVIFEKTHPDAVIPKLAYEGDACFDLFSTEDMVVPAAVSTGSGVEIGKALIPVGLRMQLPEGWEATFRTRSSFGVKSSLRIHPGTIDAGY